MDKVSFVPLLRAASKAFSLGRNHDTSLHFFLQCGSDMSLYECSDDKLSCLCSVQLSFESTLIGTHGRYACVASDNSLLLYPIGFLSPALRVDFPSKPKHTYEDGNGLIVVTEDSSYSVLI